MVFELLTTDPASAARRGRLSLRGLAVETPAFMPVGTQATVKAMTAEEVWEIGYRLILGNTYHLYLRPGADLIARAGGVHRFMAWEGAVLTDSGGYQVFSLRDLRRVGEDGVTFHSHVDGSPHTFTPERVVAIQEAIGADIIMAFDECPPYPATLAYASESLERTHAWARRCRDAHRSEGGHAVRPY
ncbi:MAG: tRNA-guanine transglycosylase, partial [Armatimonadetes bacterium]|nr:tRNA-guanine transglycosylase [Armatimonadota bacterium]